MYKKYGTNSSLSNGMVRKKAEHTYFEKTGFLSPSQNPEVQKKKQTTNLARYGFSNPAKSPEVKEKIRKIQDENYYNNLPERVKNEVIPLFSIDEYRGNFHKYNWQCVKCGNEFSDTLINGRIPICRKCNPKGSKLEKELSKQIELLGFNVIHNDRKIIKPKELDLVIPEKKLAIEICGLYWHSELYGKKVKNYHKEKLEQCLAKNYSLLTIWDYEIENPVTLERIKNKLGISERIFARQTSIRQISGKEKKEFFNTHHLNGDATSMVNLGLYYMDNLVSVMSFGKARFLKDAWEIIRYASIGSIVGGPSKLFKYFISNFNPDKVVSYSNRRWGEGEMYEKLGMVFLHNSPPCYWYIDINKTGRIYHRSSFTKKKLLSEGYDSNLTEWEIMKERGFDRIWDCGNSVWVWNQKKKKIR